MFRRPYKRSFTLFTDSETKATKDIVASFDDLTKGLLPYLLIFIIENQTKSFDDLTKGLLPYR